MVPADLTCLVRAAGLGDRLGQGPKAWVALAGVPLIDWALRPLAGRAGHVVVAVPPADVARARRRLSSAWVQVIAGGGSRWETTRRLVEAAATPWVMLHDTVHPLVSEHIVDDLMAAAERTGAAIPALPTVDFAWDADAARIAAPGSVSIIQTPVILPLGTLRAGLGLPGAADGVVDPEGSILEVLAQLGQPWAFVPGDPRNIKVTWPADLELAAALVAVEGLSGWRGHSLRS